MGEVVNLSLEDKVNAVMVERNFVFSDIHYPEHNYQAVDCAMQVMKDYKPHRIILIGDAMNMSPVSHWMQDKKRPMENKRLLGEYKGFNLLLNKAVKLAGKQLKEVVYILGNHEDWVQQYIDKHPEVEGLLEVEANVKVDNPKVKLKFVPFNEFYHVGKLALTHGLYTNKYHASKHVEAVGKSVMYGHTHDVSVHTKIGLSSEKDKHQAMSIGSLCDLSPDYMRNRPHNWIHAFALVDKQPNGYFTPHIINIIGGTTVWNGKLYKGQIS